MKKREITSSNSAKEIHRRKTGADHDSYHQPYEELTNILSVGLQEWRYNDSGALKNLEVVYVFFGEHPLPS